MNWKDFLGWEGREVAEIRYAGYCFYREGKYEKALHLFEALMILEPGYSYDLRTTGALLLQLGEKERALDLFDRSLQLEPQHELTQLNKAKVLLLLQRKKEATPLLMKLEKSIQAAIANDASALLQAYG